MNALTVASSQLTHCTGWFYLFLINGLMTFLIGLVVCFLRPNDTIFSDQATELVLYACWTDKNAKRPLEETLVH